MGLSRLLEQGDGVLTSSLPPTKLREAHERPRDPRRPGAREVLDRGLEQRLRVAPAPAPQLDGAVLGTAEREHVAAAVAIGELRDAVAPGDGALEVLHCHARADEEAAGPRARNRNRRITSERDRGRLVEAAHALLDLGARDERCALEREAEHLEVRHREPATELCRPHGVCASRLGVPDCVREVPLVESEPTVGRTGLELVQEPMGATKPATGHGLRAAKVELVDGQPDRHLRRGGGVASFTVEAIRLFASREDLVGVVLPPGGPAQPLERLRSLALCERRRELRQRRLPAPLGERSPPGLQVIMRRSRHDPHCRASRPLRPGRRRPRRALPARDGRVTRLPPPGRGRRRARPRGGPWGRRGARSRPRRCRPRPPRL